jgi:peptidoglycan/LPS O-acetylase OafA/YrhL
VATYLVLVLGLNYNQAAAAIVRRQEWLGSFAPFDPSLATLLHYSFAGVFTDDSVARSYNAFLWPMQIELIGSFFLFAFLYATANSSVRTKITLVAFAIAFFVAPFYSLFFVGLLLCDFRHSGGFDALHADKRWRYGSLLILACCIAFVTISYIYTDMLKTQLIAQPAAQTAAESAPAKVGLFKLYGVRDKVYSLVAAAIVFAIYANLGMLGFFRNKLSRFLGRISFPLYLLHFAIIISMTSYLIVRYLNPAVDGLTVPLTIGLVSVFAALAAAAAFEPLERYLLNMLNKIVNRVVARG